MMDKRVPELDIKCKKFVLEAYKVDDPHNICCKCYFYNRDFDMCNRSDLVCLSYSNGIDNVYFVRRDYSIKEISFWRLIKKIF